MEEELDPKLLAVLACPMCKGDLGYNDRKNGLLCKDCDKTYPITCGVAMFLPNSE